jgi:putative Mg2+ transporter-C (MgtC) family protein
VIGEGAGQVLATANLEGWLQVGELALAFLLASAVGLERELRQRSAGLRTHALVGTGAASFMLVSKYGFSDVVSAHVTLDPSRVAAQIVSGIGFIGAGLIFVRRDGVRGLTTAASIWVTAAIGAAAGAGLPVLAVVACGIYFVVALCFPFLTRRFPSSSMSMSLLHLRYSEGSGVLRAVLKAATEGGFSVDEVSTLPGGNGSRGGARSNTSNGASGKVEMVLQVRGHGRVDRLTAAISEIGGVDAVTVNDLDVSEG